MPKFGGMSPHPRKLGGGTPRAKTIFNSMAADRGTAFDVLNPATLVYCETLAMARAISAGYGTNERVARLWHPMSCPDGILGRWETMLSLSPAPGASLYSRRVAATAILARFGNGLTNAYLSSVLTTALGAGFGSVDHIGYAYAAAAGNVLVPDGTYPYGTVGANPWSSSVCKLLVRLQYPAGMPVQTFYEQVIGGMFAALDPILPAWVTVDWYVGGIPGVAMSDGPTQAGFFLDETGNLDGSIFDS